MKQYKSNIANDAVARAFGDLDQFAKEWDVRHLKTRMTDLR
jgi:hypothetical protein